jgi:hypothetical protein
MPTIPIRVPSKAAPPSNPDDPALTLLFTRTQAATLRELLSNDTALTAAMDEDPDSRYIDELDGDWRDNLSSIVDLIHYVIGDYNQE